MPANLYGPNDNFDLQNGHVIPALIRKLHEAKIKEQNHITLWGTGKVRREFLFVDDLADACIFLMNVNVPPKLINIGSGRVVTIRDLAAITASVVGYEGQIAFDRTKPDGSPSRLLDSTRLHAAGWTPSTSLEKGLDRTYRWYLNTVDNAGM